jgi:hypothetical protein
MSGDGWKHMPPDQPRTCAGCGRKIVLTRAEPLWFKTFEPLQSWHAACRLKVAA